ncbi:hypothetical protein V8G54_037456 [Vigna mungo]|uniref:Uncharacterized protein n=1 Tax=Vigna mungo TaxID=3915 RepID=A0AAQ3MIW7_VIGMU
MYNDFPVCHTAMIDDFVGTALHVAVDLDQKNVVAELVNAIIRHSQGARVKALEMGNDGGDTPLHVAASKAIGVVNELKETKKKHQLGPRLLKELLKRPYAAMTGRGTVPYDIPIDADMYNVYNFYKGIYLSIYITLF